MRKYSILSPTKQQKTIRQTFGFDIETYDNNKKFLMASIYDGKEWKIFYSREDVIREFSKKRYKSSFVCATNLSFDFMGTYYGLPEIQDFNMLWRGSDMIYSKSYIGREGYHLKRDYGLQPITFIDTMNYARLSVEKMGKIIDLLKLEKPECLGRKPVNDNEWNELIEYNKRDSEISKKFIDFLFSSFMDIGASPRMTIASTSMSLFKNKYLDRDYFRHEIWALLELFNGYYGGRTEAFSRGFIQEYNYFDFNSLYPSVMRNEYPNPNTMRISKVNSFFNILQYEGLSHVRISCPEMKYPLLPVKIGGKLIFPTGTFDGWYTHAELRKAKELGYTLMKVYKTYYYKENCDPFRKFVDDMYNTRMKYKAVNNPMEYVVKILMNSLYGKFGQKFDNKENVVPESVIDEDFLINNTILDRRNGFCRIKSRFNDPPSFTVPIWAIYTTAYARLKLHECMLMTNPIYVDTDSLITKEEIRPSDELGKLKLEYKIIDGVIVKPKFYMIRGDKFEKCRSKGIGVKLTGLKFMSLVRDRMITYEKFMKFKESIRRGFIPNEIQDITKRLSLEDNKRVWDSAFDINSFQSSEPVSISVADQDNDMIPKFQAISL